MKWVEPRPHGALAKDWAALIPAAGKGSRLGYDRPKILFEVGGKSILEWMLGSLASVADEAVLVVHPTARAEIEAAARQLRVRPPHVRFVEQPAPTGMADAIERGLTEVTRSYVWIVWGDQPFLREERLAAMGAALVDDGLAGIVPLVRKRPPYVHYELDASDRLTAVRQRREGDRLPDEGLSDAGCFAFRSESLRSVLRSSARELSMQTREWNFLPELPRLETEAGGLGFVELESDAPETVSINDRAEAAAAEEWLRRRERSS